MRRLMPILLFGTVMSGALPARAGTGVVEFRTTFAVRNVNRSRVPCQSDGLPYRLSGRIALPNAVASTGRGQTATLYVHSPVLSERTEWTFDAVPGYDLLAEMARRGHPSATFDLPGWGESPYPDGFAVCLGSEADMAHQIVRALKAGNYLVQGLANAPRFDRVVIAGLSSSGLIAQIEAYSFHDVAGLIVMAWAELTDPGFATPETAIAGPPVFVTCAAGGEPKNDPDGPPGYGYTWYGGDADKTAALFFHHADPAVVGVVKDRIERDPCGDRLSGGQALVADQLFLPTITAPVLLVYGEQDRIFRWPTVERQRLHFVRSPDVKVTCLASTGHMLPLHPTRDVLYTQLGSWLTNGMTFQPNHQCTPPPSGAYS
jgi:pimeloyl-ACP methyl ester carboxylesterase